MLELDVNDEDDLAAVAAELDARWGAVDGVLHAIAHAPDDALGGAFLETGYESAAQAFRTSAYSLQALARHLAPLLELGDGGAIVGLDFDATVAWPAYDWMGVAKAALESTSRYLARDLGPRGVRVNLVSAGPVETAAAGGIPGSATSRPHGPRGLRSAGTRTTRPRSRAPCASCCRTGPRRSAARSSTSTAAFTRSARRCRRTDPRSRRRRPPAERGPRYCRARVHGDRDPSPAPRSRRRLRRPHAPRGRDDGWRRRPG